MSDQMNVGEYSLEISGDEIVVRDESGAIVETVELDQVDGELTLPDGQKIDLAAILADNGIEAFHTGAGPANDNTGAAEDGSGSFRHLRETQDKPDATKSAGALDGTSLIYGTGEAGHVPAQQSHVQARASFDWAQHDPANSDQSNSNGDQRSSSDDRRDGEDTEEDETSGSSSEPLPQDSASGSGNDVQYPPAGEQQQPPAQDAQGEDQTPPSDEQQPPAQDAQGEVETPPSDEQQPPAQDAQGEDETPPSDEQQPPAQDMQGEDETPPSDEQQPPAQDAEGEDETPPGDEQQQPPAQDAQGEDETSPSEEQQPQANEQANFGPSNPQPPANSAPTDIDLSGKSVVENVSGAIIGQLSAVDPDAGDTHSFTVSDNRFEVANGYLKLKDGVSLDFESGSNFDITVTVTDQAGNQFDENFTIGVVDANEVPTAIHLSNLSVNENAAGATIGTLTTSDPDAGDTFSYQVSDNRFQVVNGQLQLKSGISLDHEAEPTVSLKITSTDSAGHSIHQNFTVDVANVNEAPVVSATGDTYHGNSFQPTVDFSDVDSTILSKAVIHTTGFLTGDSLTVPASNLFSVSIDHSSTNYTITIVGKTGHETVDQYEDFANTISFSTSSNTTGHRYIDYTVTDSGGLSSNASSADVSVFSHQELYTSQFGKGQTTVGAGDDTLYIDSKSFSSVDMGDGEDTVHIAQQGRAFNHQDAIKLNNVETLDATGYGNNAVSLSIHDVLSMTDTDHHLTIIGDKGDTVTLTNSGNNHWSLVSTGAEFSTYVYNDPAHQAIVEISNQMSAQVS